ncbi:TPA: right-handed parallel beta-helix repeat-containing protein, partial [Klebsiella pneumoniae]
MAFNPELGSTSPAVLLDNAERLDKLVNGPAADVPDRGGDPLYSWRQMMAKNDEVRQNLIPLSKQYMTLAAAQADIANIPEGSTTYYRSPDDSALAIEVINNGGTLQPTGRKMPSQASIEQKIAFDDLQVLGRFHDDSGNAYLQVDLSGEVFLVRVSPKSLQETLRDIADTVNRDSSANLHDFPDINQQRIAFLDDTGDLYIPGLGRFSVQHKIRALDALVGKDRNKNLSRQYDNDGQVVNF